MRSGVQVFYKAAPYLWKSAQERARAMRAKEEERAKKPSELFTEAEREEHEHVHEHAQIIRRTSLRTLMPTYKKVFAKLFKAVEVVEPTYKDIILLYRCAPPSALHMHCFLLDEGGAKASQLPQREDNLPRVMPGSRRTKRAHHERYAAVAVQ